MSETGLLLKDRYRIEKELGRGGIGVVYLARDEQLHARQVVVKVLLDRSEGSEWLQKKFRQEIQALVRIDHPGVVGALDAGEMPDGKPFLVMQFVQGTTLRSLMKAGTLDLAGIAVVIRQVGAALTAAHEKGVHHRDLKPENIMVQDLGHDEMLVKIIDFGIATVRDPAEEGTRQTEIAGSVLYMAPEQLLGKPQAATDTYALAVIAYEMLAGTPPFCPDTPFELLDMQRKGVGRKPSEAHPGLPRGVDELVLRSLSFDAKARHASAREFGEEVARALTGNPKATGPEAEPPTVLVDRARTAVTPLTQTQPGPTVPAPTAAPAPDLEMAHVLFMDIVGYSMLPMDHQREVLGTLQGIIQATAEFRRAHSVQELISLPTGDGMALVFSRDPTAPVRCALEVAQALKAQPQIRLRMGIHTGAVYRVADINANLNVAGGGINIAQRVMDSGDAGHILVSQAVADVVGQLSQWSGSLHDLGEHPVKHGVRIRLYSLHTPEFGNPARPSKLRTGEKERRPPGPEPRDQPGPSPSRARWLAGGVVVVLLFGAGGYLLTHRKPGPDAGSPSVSTLAPAPGPTRELSYYLTVQKYQGGQPYSSPFRMAREMLFGPDDRLRVTVTSSQAGCIYIVNEGPDPGSGQITYNVLYPRAAGGVASANLAEGQEVHIPSPDTYFKLDQARGTESLWLIFAGKEVPELEAVKGLANPNDKGVVKDPAQVAGVRRVLGRYSAARPEAVPDETTKRTLLKAKGDLLVGLLKLEHM
jgi:class 3 adenylate cyclase/predicted Ser/Thr protein kinase